MIRIKRKNIENKINSFSTSTNNNPGILHLYGIYGVGKTTILKDYYKNINETEYGIYISLGQFEINNLEQIKNETLNIIYKSKINHKINKINKSEILKAILDSVDLGLGTSKDIIVSPIKILTSFISQLYESYTTSIDNSKADDLIMKLSQIIVEIMKCVDSKVTILIDEIDKIDCYTSKLLYSLIRNNVVSNIIITSEFETQKMPEGFLESIKEQIHNENSIMTNLTINEFTLSETCEYLSQYYDKAFQKNDITVSNIQNLTAGLPFLLSIVFSTCSIEEIENLEINKDKLSERINIILMHMCESLSDISKTILVYLALCGGATNTHTLICILGENKTFNGLSELLEKKIIIETNSSIILKHKIFNEKIIDLSNKSKIELTYMYQNIIKNSADDEISLTSKYNAARFLNDIENEINFVINLSQKYLENNENEKCIKVIQNSNFLYSENISQDNKTTLACFIAKAFYRVKKLEKCIEIYNYFNLEDIPEMILIAAQSYYYLNNYECTIKVCKKLCEGNSFIQHRIYLLEASSYDLCGKYNASKKIYDKGYKLAETENDYYAIAIYDMCVQMISCDYNFCVDKLNSATNTFINYKDIRMHACSLNNLGVEMLMNGDASSLQLLNSSLIEFNKMVGLESQFPKNNLGIYYALIEKNYIKARAFFMDALDFAVSPLQYSYIYNNIIIIDFFQKKIDDSIIEETLFYLDKCPDPIVNLVVTYNLACISNNYIKHLENAYNMYYKICNPQYNSIIHKCNELLNYSKKHNCLSNINSRRKLIDKQKLRFGELMFYN